MKTISANNVAYDA